VIVPRHHERVRTVFALLALAVALAGAGAAGATRPATPDGRLLARHAPVLVLHPEERFAPVPVDGFLADSDALVAAPDGTWTPTTLALPQLPATSRLDQRSCRAVDGPAAIDCYASAQDAHAAAPAVYGAVLRTPTRIALQYWLFYPYDLWSPTVPPGPFWQGHEGDWELVTVLLDRRERPQLVGLSRHCGGVRRAWAKALKRNGRPLVWVSLGSHANGFGPGIVPEERRCWPSEALAIYDAFKVALVDHAAAGRVVTPRVVRVDAAAPPWMRFRGTWGEDQYAGFPNVAPFRFGAGPRGPAQHTAWRAPVATPAGWLPG
jgi:hypothetical protein